MTFRIIWEIPMLDRMVYGIYCTLIEIENFIALQYYLFRVLFLKFSSRYQLEYNYG